MPDSSPPQEDSRFPEEVIERLREIARNMERSGRWFADASFLRQLASGGAGTKCDCQRQRGELLAKIKQLRDGPFLTRTDRLADDAGLFYELSDLAYRIQRELETGKSFLRQLSRGGADEKFAALQRMTEAWRELSAGLEEECVKRGLPQDFATLMRHLENNHATAIGSYKSLADKWQERAEQAEQRLEEAEGQLEEIATISDYAPEEGKAAGYSLAENVSDLLEIRERERDGYKREIEKRGRSEANRSQPAILGGVATMHAHPAGDWVRYTDHDAEVAEWINATDEADEKRHRAEKKLALSEEARAAAEREHAETTKSLQAESDENFERALVLEKRLGEVRGIAGELEIRAAANFENLRTRERGSDRVRGLIEGEGEGFAKAADKLRELDPLDSLATLDTQQGEEGSRG